MRIALISHDVVKGDGQGRVNFELVRALLAEGLAVDVLADRVADDLIEAGARWVPVRPRLRRVNLLKVWDFSRRADRALDAAAGQYDAVLACGVVTSRPHHLNVAHFVHGTWLRSPYHASRVRPGLNGIYQRVYSAWNARWERASFARASVVIALSDMVRGELIAVGVPADKIEVIVNGVDLVEYAPGPAERGALGLPEDVPLGLFVGDLRSPIKNLDTVLRALPDVPGVHIAVAGTLDGSPYPTLAERLSVADRVHFVGFRRDVPDLMRAADFFVLPSRRDSCPLVLLEAMASGLPVITASTVGTSTLISPACGFVMDGPDDDATLVHALCVMAADPVRRQAMSRAVREVAEQHSWQAMTAQYLPLFQRYADEAACH